MEIYTNTQTTLVLDISGNSNPAIVADSTPIVTIYDSNAVLQATVTATEEFGGIYSFVFPLWLTQAEAKFQIKWEYSISGRAYHRTEYAEVVFPYATLDQLRTFDDGLSTMSDSGLIELERIARYTIDSITGQHFGRSEGMYAIPGTNSDTLTVPQRIINVDSITFQWGNIGDLQDIGVYVIDEYTLGYAPWAYATDWNWSVTTQGVIFAPPLGDNYFFNDAQVYVLAGEFGWESVPDDINLATKLLVRDFACNDDIYRRKGVTEFTSSSSSIKFGGMTDTGNVDVDRILDSYAVPGWAVI